MALTWTNVPDEDLTVGHVRNALEPIQDDLWVAAACVDRLVDDAAVQRALLELGIERTEIAAERSKEACLSSPRECIGNVEDSGQIESQRQYNALVAHFRTVPSDAQLCHIRALLLERLDRLNTFVEICKEGPRKEDMDDEESIEVWEDDPWGDEESSTALEKQSAASTPIPLSVFLADDLLRTACFLASQGWLSALKTLITRHGLWSYRFVVLDSIPEHIPPTEYQHFLPAFDPSSNTEQMTVEKKWRPEIDWTEGTVTRTAVQAAGVTTLGPVLLQEQSSYPKPLSNSELTTWYKNRVDQLVKSTGMVDNALTTIQYGASQGIPDLDELGEDLSLLSRLVYDSPRPADSDANWDDDWTLGRWTAANPPDIVRAYLAHSTPDTISKDIPRLVMPYLFVLESRAERVGHPDPSLPTRLLYDYVLSARLGLAAAVFEASKPTLPAAHRLIRNDEDVVRLALACLYGSDSLDDWPTMSRIFECLPAWDIANDVEGDKNAVDSTIVTLGQYVRPSTTRPSCTASDLLLFFNPLPFTSLSRALDVLDVHLESGEILSRWGVPAPLRWFLQSNNDVAEQRSRANRMARRVGVYGSDAQEDWERLLEDMLRLSGHGDTGLKGAFGLLSSNEVIRVFLSGLLSTGNFQIARNLLHSPKSKHKLALEPDAIEDICLSCSREFYDNADSGNYRFGDMKLAYECLDVPPFSARLLKEKDFIEATSRLSSFNLMSRPGIPISPIEIRLTKDRLSLVSRVLSSNVDAYKHTEVILDLVYKLGFRDDAVAKIRVFAMLADTAFQAEDFNRAFEISQRMIDTVLELRSAIPPVFDARIQEASEICWVTCFQLGRQQEFSEVQKRLLLLGRALELCPSDKLHDILTIWHRLEKEDVQTRRERLSNRHSGKYTDVSSPNPLPGSRLQDFGLPSSSLGKAPDIASRTFNRVAANFPFSVGRRGRDVGSRDERSRSGSRQRPDVTDVSAQATRVLNKGISWLIGAESDAER